MDLPIYPCIVLSMRQDDRLPGKHAKHEPHDWWHTSSGGGHQMFDGFDPEIHKDIAATEKNLKQYHCPGETQ